MGTINTNSMLRAAMLSAMLACGGLAAPAVLAASADPVDYDVELQAKVANAKLKQARIGGNQIGTRRPGTRDESCGTIDIGNTDSSRSAVGRVAPRDKTVIVTGPVINAARCR